MNKEELLIKTGGRLFWYAVLASGTTYLAFTGDIRRAVIFLFMFTFIFFVVITIAESFFDNKK